jgi:hypothetical protein
VTQVLLQTYPFDDQEFGADAHLALDSGPETPLGLELLLRERYPSVRVVDGIKDGLLERWYAYRDGVFVAFRDSQHA